MPSVSKSLVVRRQISPIFSSRSLHTTLILSLAFYLNSLLWWTEPRDYSEFLLPWYQHLVQAGRVAAFAHPFSNYEPPYLYLLSLASLSDGLLSPLYAIKLLSLAGTAFLLVAVAQLLQAAGGQRRDSLLVLLVPGVILNAGLLAQCDALWAGACILALAAMCRGHTIAGLVWCGIAFAFKAQAAFIAPVVLGILVGRRVPLWQWAIPPVVWSICMLPAWLIGWPALDLLLVYPRQAGTFDWPGRLANPWVVGTMFAPEQARKLFLFGYIAAAAAGIWIAAIAARFSRDPRRLMVLSFLCATALPFLLPKMLERYYFLAEVLGLAVAATFRTRSALLLALGVQLASLLSLLTYMYWYDWLYPTLAGAVLATAAIVISWRLLEPRQSCPVYRDLSPKMWVEVRPVRGPQVSTENSLHDAHLQGIEHVAPKRSRALRVPSGSLLPFSQFNSLRSKQGNRIATSANSYGLNSLTSRCLRCLSG